MASNYRGDYDNGPLQEAKGRFDAPAWMQNRGLDVQRRGDHATIRCPDPAHPDNRPSCSLRRYTTGWGWRCFSCGATGDAVSLVQILSSCSMGEAIAEVHRYSGVPMPERNNTQDSHPQSSRRNKPRKKPWSAPPMRGSLAGGKGTGSTQSRSGTSEGSGSRVGYRAAPTSSPTREAGRQRLSPLRPQGGSVQPPHDEDGWHDSEDGPPLDAYDGLALGEDFDTYGEYPTDPYDTHLFASENPPLSAENGHRWEQSEAPSADSEYGHNMARRASAELSSLDLASPLEVTEAMVQRFERIDVGQSERLSRICRNARIGNRSDLLSQWLNLRGWSPNVVEQADIHVAARQYDSQRLVVVRHPFYGFSQRMLGWADRVQRTDRQRIGQEKRWLANSGPPPPLVGAHSLNGQPVALVAEGVSDWVTLLDNAPSGAAALCVPGAGLGWYAARELMALLRGRHVVVFGDRDKAGAGLSAVIAAAAAAADLSVVWAAPDDGDLSDLLATSARTHNPDLARSALRASLASLVHDLSNGRVVSGSHRRLSLP